MGRVADADTGAALKPKLVFTDDDGNSHSVWATGKYRALLPGGERCDLSGNADVAELSTEGADCSFAAYRRARDATRYSAIETIERLDDGPPETSRSRNRLCGIVLSSGARFWIASDCRPTGTAAMVVARRRSGIDLDVASRTSTIEGRVLP